MRQKENGESKEPEKSYATTQQVVPLSANANNCTEESALRGYLTVE